MKSMPLILAAGLAISLSYVGSSDSATNPERREERRIERSMRGPTDKHTEEMLREEEKIEEEPGGGEKYLKREQRAAAKEERRLQKLSSQVAKPKKHHSYTIPPS